MEIDINYNDPKLTENILKKLLAWLKKFHPEILREYEKWAEEHSAFDNDVFDLLR
jgi:hypothetical protein